MIPNSTTSTKILWLIFLTVFIDMLGIGVLIPVFPLLILPSSAFNILPQVWTHKQAFVMAGWLMATFPLMQFVFTPILGQLADKYGRRKILAFSITGTAISYLIFAYAVITKNLPLLFISRAFDGASGGNISVAQAVIGDISDPKYRARNFGLVGMALGSGFILGPFIGGKLSDPMLVGWFNAATPFIFTAILSFINVILVLSFLPETLKGYTKQAFARPKFSIDLGKPFRNIIKAFANQELRRIMPVVFLFNAGFTFFTTFWGVVLATRFDFNQSQIGNFFAYFGIMVVLAQGVVVRRLSGKVLDYQVLRYSIIGTGFCLLMYYFIPKDRIAWIYYIPPLLAVYIALTKSFSVALITRITPTNILGEVMGINSSCTALANAIPAIIAGYLAAQYAILPVMVGGITVLSGGLLFNIVYRKFVKQ